MGDSIFVGGSVSGSLVGTFRGPVTIVNDSAASAADRLAHEAEAWLDSHSFQDAGYASVCAISNGLQKKDERGVRAFMKRNWESIASDVAATALWEAIKLFIAAI